MLVTSIGKIREKYPNARMHIFSYLPQDDQRICLDENIRFYKAKPAQLVFLIFPFSVMAFFMIILGLRKLAKKLPAGVGAIATSSVFIDISGVSFMDGRVKFIPYNLLTHWPAMFCRVPLVKLSQAMGPFTNPLIRLTSKTVLPFCSLLVSRGEKTYSHIQSLLPKHKAHIMASDIAMLYKNDYSLSDEGSAYTKTIINEIQVIKKSNAKTKVLGFCPSAVLYKKLNKQGIDYIGSLLHFIRGLLESSVQLVIFPNATRENADDHFNNDFLVIRELRKRLGDSGETILWVDKDLNTKNIRFLIAQFDYCLVSRFHAMVASLCEKVPTAVIGWSHKYLEIMNQFSMQNNVYDFKEIAKWKKQDYTALLKELETTDTSHFKKALTSVQSNAQGQFDALNKIINENQ